MEREDVAGELAQLEAELAATRQRIADLEAQERRGAARAGLATGLGVAAAAVGVLLVGARPGQSQVSAQAAGTRVKAPFTVVDNKGRAILQVGASDKKRWMLFKDSAGKLAVRMTAGGAGRGLDVLDANEVAVVGMGTYDGPDGHYRGIDTFDASGKHQLNLGEEPGTTGPGVRVHTPDGANLATLEVVPNGGITTGRVVLKTTDARELVVQPQ